MKKIYKFSLFILTAGVYSTQVQSQCASPTTLGSASNVFSVIRNGTNPVAVDKNLNTILFVHRNDAGTFGGNSGELRYDLSTNAGTTWTSNIGTINSATANLARYPNGGLYNTANNTNPMNAYVTYMAPTINSSSAWNGIITGVKQLNGTGQTESFNQNGIGTTMLPHSLVNGAPGVMWATEYLSTYMGYNIYKGVWNSNINDFVWNINYVVNPPYNTSLSSFPTVTDYNIAFDPTGVIGYFSFLGHVTPGPTNYGLYPVLYKTTNGGNTWTGPIQVDLTTLSCIASNTTSGGVPSTNTEHDLVVDAQGNPHIVTTVGSAANYIFNYSAWHHMYDITLKNGMWVAYDLGNTNGSTNTMGTSPDIATQNQAPQAARSANGNKVFFTWTDNSSYTLGQANSSPDLYGKAFDITTNMWTPTKNFSSCNTALAGKVYFPHLAPDVLEPSTNTWKLAEVLGEPINTSNLLLAANFKFIDNVTFASTDFSIAVPAATVNIAQAPSIIYCPNTTVNVNVTGAGQVLWSNGSTLIPMPITTGSISTYSVVAQVACLIGTASIAVNNLTFTAGAVTPSICPGQAATFTASGNALNYSWIPGTSTGSNVSLFPTSNTVSLNAYGTGSCFVTNTVAVSIMPLPTISITGNNTVCVGELVTLTGNGGTGYAWSNSTTGNTYTTIITTTVPATNTVSVIGTGANSCTNTANIVIKVNPLPNVNVSSSQPSVCLGQTVSVTGTGATTYSLDGVGGGQNYLLTPTSTAVYTLTGANTFSCTKTATVMIAVLPLPQLTVTPSRTLVCKGEKVTLTASGANGYTWSPGSVFQPTIILNAQNAQTYNFQVTMSNTTGCTNSETYSIAVNACAGISELNSSAFMSVYPNPNNGSFNVVSTEDMHLVLVNELGQDVWSAHLDANNNHQVNVKDIAAGVYYLRIKDRPLSEPQKIIINR